MVRVKVEFLPAQNDSNTDAHLHLSTQIHQVEDRIVERQSGNAGARRGWPAHDQAVGAAEDLDAGAERYGGAAGHIDAGRVGAEDRA